MNAKILNITPRGQITLPKEVRNILKTTTITIELLDDNRIIISPVADIGGAMAEFSKPTDLSFSEIRDNALTNSSNQNKKDS